MRNFYFLRTLFAGFILLISISVGAQVTLLPVDDGTAFKEWPDTTAAEFHPGGNIFVYKTDSTEAIAFVKFDIEKFEGKIVSEAIFSTRSDMNDGKTMTVKLTKAGSTDFTRDSLSWNNKPGTSGELATVVYDENSGRKEFTPNGTNLSDFINEALAQGKKYIAFGINYKDGDGGDFKWAGGAGNGSWGPMLELTFDEGFNYWAVDDGTAFKEWPDTTAAGFHSGGNIFVWKTDSTEAIAFVKFSLPGFANKTVESAEFSTRSDMNDGKTMIVALVGANSSDFTRDELNWNNKPGTGGELATVLMDEDSGRKTYTETGSNLIDFINSVLAEGKEEIAFALKYKSGDGGDFKWAGGAGNGAWGPMLMVTEGMGGAGYATDDGVATQNHPDSVATAFHPTNLFVTKSSDTTEQISYVKFDISAFAGKQAEVVKFSTRGSMNADDKTMTVGLYEAKSTDFTRSTLNWNNKPGVGKELATVVFVRSSDRKYYIQDGTKLVDYVNEKLMSGDNEIAFALKYKEGDGADLSWIGGKGDGAYGPLLELEFGYDFNSYAIDDGSGFQEMPDTSAFWKHNSNIFVYKTDSTHAIAYVKFDVSALAGKAVTDATFSTRAAMNADDKTMTVSLVGTNSANFTRSGLTWNNRPGTGDELATVEIERSSARKEYIPNGTKLVDYVNDKLAAMESEIAFAIKFKEGDGGNFSWCGGAGDGAYGPQLELEIEQPFTKDTITVIEDAYVLEAYPDSVGEGIAAMQVGRDDANSDEKQTFIKFPIAEANFPVGKATLVLKGDVEGGEGAGAYPFKIQVFGADNAWSEDTLKWVNKPQAGSGVLANYDITESAFHEISSNDLTHYINALIKAEAENVSFMIKGKDDTGDNHAWISSKEWKAATLILDNTVAPPPQEGNVIEDAYVSQAEAERDTAIGNEADQHLINDDTNESSKWIYFKYDLSNAYDNPVSAVLKLYGSIHNSVTDLTEFDYQIFAGESNSWSEDTITWNNKPGVSNNVLLEGTLVNGGDWYELSSPALSEYIAEAVENGKDQITLVAKGKVETPGKRAWISGKEWRASSLIINYEPQVEAPVFNPVPGEFIANVDVEILNATPNATVYYTTDGSEPTDASNEYIGKITLTENTTLKAIGYADELKPSLVTSGEYIVHPVGVPELFPSPSVTYTDDNPPVVTVSIEPEDALIFYSDDGSEPLTPYPAGGIPITTTTTLKVQAYTADGTYFSEVVEATYIVEASVEGLGAGPAGIGYSETAISGQPEKALWLKADEISGKTDGDTVGTWVDYSGKMNHATDDWAGQNLIDDNGNKVYEKQPNGAPSYVAQGIGGKPALNFGDASNFAALVIPDENEETGEEDFDGIGGFSMWIVLKRNVADGNWQSILQKRDNQTSKTWSWIMEFNGGGDKDQPTLTLEQGSNFTTGQAITDTESGHIIGANYRDFEKVSQYMDGKFMRSKLYTKPIIDNNAFVVIGDAVKANIGEVVFYKNGLNEPQKVIIQNYLAAKYGIDISSAGIPVYSGQYAEELIGVGKAMYGENLESHTGASGGALQLTQVSSTFEADEYVFAAHNGAENAEDETTKTWARRWYIQKSEGASVDVSLGFDFAAAELTTPASTDGYALWHSTDGETFTALSAAPTMEGDVMVFDLADVADGYYVLSVGEVTNNRAFSDMNDLVKLYPNPTTQKVNLVINNAFEGEFTINIHNMTGSLVRQILSRKPAGTYTERFDVSQYKPGMYIIEVVQGNKRALKRLIKK